MSFPTFNGGAGEDAQEFLDNLEIACLVTGQDDDVTRLRVFPLLMKAEAKAWFNTLLPANRGDWAGLRVLFLAKFGGGGETSEILWGKVCELRQGSLFEYNVYELQFVELWESEICGTNYAFMLIVVEVVSKKDYLEWLSDHEKTRTGSRDHFFCLREHPYHLVNPSPWPFLGSLGALASTIGAVMYMHSFPGDRALLALGLGSILFTMFVCPLHHFGFEATARYRHFVDVVWLFLFVSIYWWEGL
ncbi:hypothetical protein L7F22_003350 [Adiantum nelumboides]|nr:hypothetical protein [Adiantum nelumboides]